MSRRCFPGGGVGGCGCLDVPKGGGCLGTRLQETSLVPRPHPSRKWVW